MIFILNEHHFSNLESSTKQHQQQFQSQRLSLNNNNQTKNKIPSPILIWNNLDATNWNTSWRSKLLHFDPPVRFTGMFEMNGIVYAIGESTNDNHSHSISRRIGKMYRYYVTENDGRDFKELVSVIRISNEFSI